MKMVSDGLPLRHKLHNIPYLTIVDMLIALSDITFFITKGLATRGTF